MTTSNNKKDISEILWANAQINQIRFEKKEFLPTNKGHGPFVKTIGRDILYDLRLAKEKPFLGHGHPLVIHHNFKNFSAPLELHQYSVPKTEYIRIIETFQKIHFTQILASDFKITYHNIVIDLDEDLLNFDFVDIKSILSSLINNNLETNFWIVEKDIALLSPSNIFYFLDLMSSKHVHLCIDFHFVSSIFIYSHHLFSEDENIQFFLAIKSYFHEVISFDKKGKNFIDYNLIDQFLVNNNMQDLVCRKGRYLIIFKNLHASLLNNNGIIASHLLDPYKSILAIPLACTNDELIDILNRIKYSIEGKTCSY